jgi:hypothetical protein
MLGYILLLIYLLSVLKMWLFVHNIYGPEGRWSRLSPEAIDIFMVFCPVINTVIAITELGSNGKVGQENSGSLIKKLFNIK